MINFYDVACDALHEIKYWGTNRRTNGPQKTLDWLIQKYNPSSNDMPKVLEIVRLAENADPHSSTFREKAEFILCQLEK
tara:strand:- start:284 stop:520 length:237 start_codon:yes stop_codon:yes gene_type:complete